jgi:YD repeat-containing protein
MRITAALFILFGVAAPAFANWEERCAPNTLRGSVRSITLYDVTVDQSGLPIREFKKSDEQLTRDGRTRTRVVYEADTPTQIQLQMFPTHVSEYDENGRLLRAVLKLNGRDDHDVTRCEYDADGRVAVVRQSSKNFELDDRLITYSYGHRWRRERWQSPVTVAVTTQYLDSQGRPIREEYARDIPSENFRETVESVYEYDSRFTRICVSTDGQFKFCHQRRVDQHGNVVESISDGGTTTTAYEYDARGNWTSEKVVSTITIGGGTTQLVRMSRREITYW